MKPHVRRWMEKLQVQAAAVGAMALGWYAIWPMVRPDDPEGALALLPDGAFGQLLILAVATWVLAALCSLATLSARPNGALLATLAGVAGVAFRAGTSAELLRQTSGGLKGAFILLAAETAVMAAILSGAAIVITGVRAGAKRVASKWHWPDDQETTDALKTGPWTATTAHVAACMIVELALAVVLLAVTFRSFDDGQIAFSLALSFFVGALLAHHMFPITTPAAYWAPPLIVGVGILALGGIAAQTGGPRWPQWYQALMVAEGLPMRSALPVHWLAYGCGGAILGLWVAERMRLPAPIPTE